MSLYKRTPNRVGGGANTNVNGLSFEGRTSLLDSLNNNQYIKIDDLKVFYKGNYIGYYTEKHRFYKDFIEKKGVSWKDKISKKYLPDGVFVNELNKVVYIIEKKYQESSGSVDEKLQTCDFKKKIYSKLINETGYKTEYFYLWNDWFLRKEYDDVKEYILAVGCKFFINEIDLNELGIK